MDYNQFFKDAKAAINNVNKLNSQVSGLEKEKRQIASALESEKRNVAGTIEHRIRKRRSEIENTYNSELDKINDALRRANAKRAKAKNQGMKERISEETFPLKDANRNLRNQIKANFRNDQVPFYCSWGIFFRLFYPSSVLDFLTIIIAFAIFFLAIPFGIWHFVFQDKGTVALVIIYVFDILIFGGAVVLINRATVLKHQTVLKDTVQLRKTIATNNKKIENIERSIRNDTSEDSYDLGSFDDEIARIKQKLADVTMKKNDALNTFENVTKNIITDEINNNAKPKLDDMANKLSALSEKLAGLESERNAARLDLSNNYEVYLGREFMSVEKIDALADIMAHGTASNLNEAIEEYKDKLYDI